MRHKIFAVLTASALLLNVVGLASADTRGPKSKKRQGNQLVALLPASDGLATFDAHRFLGALPQLLAKSPGLLSKITSHFTDIETKTGIDIRKFDSVAVGATIVKTDPKKFTMDPVAIARGAAKADAVLASARLAAKGTSREERYANHTVVVFTPKQALQNTGSTGVQTAAKVADTFGSLSHEVAVTVLDGNTLAIGSVSRVHETIDGTTHISPELVSLLPAAGSSVMAFAVKTPNGMSAFLPLENDDLGNSIDSIQYVSGTVDVTTAGANVKVAASTIKAEQAKALYDTLDQLKTLGKAFLGGSKRADQQVYARLIDNAKLSVKANVVSLEVLLPQADIDVMLASVK